MSTRRGFLRAAAGMTALTLTSVNVLPVPADATEQERDEGRVRPPADHALVVFHYPGGGERREVVGMHQGEPCATCTLARIDFVYPGDPRYTGWEPLELHTLDRGPFRSWYDPMDMECHLVPKAGAGRPEVLRMRDLQGGTVYT